MDATFIKDPSVQSRIQKDLRWH